MPWFKLLLNVSNLQINLSTAEFIVFEYPITFTAHSTRKLIHKSDGVKTSITYASTLVVCIYTLFRLVKLLNVSEFRLYICYPDRIDKTRQQYILYVQILFRKLFLDFVYNTHIERIGFLYINEYTVEITRVLILPISYYIVSPCAWHQELQSERTRAPANRASWVHARHHRR